MKPKRYSTGLLICLFVLLAGCSQSTSPPDLTSQPAQTYSLPVVLTATGAPPTQLATPGDPPTQIPLASLTPSTTSQPTLSPPTAVNVPFLPDLPTVTNLNSCPGAQLSILMPGTRGRVSDAAPASNRVRSQPTTQAEISGEMLPGVSFDVLAGPQCADGMAWFEVRNEDGLQGWMAEGDASEYWVMPVLSEPQTQVGPQIELPPFSLNLPPELGRDVQVLSLPFDPQTRTPPVTIAHLVDYPLEGRRATVYIYDIEDYLYYRPEGRRPLEQLRYAINRLLDTSRATVSLANPVISLSLGDSYWPQAGTFSGGLGIRAIAMLAPSGSSQPPVPHYAFWGFSQDMRYLIFATLELQLTVEQLPQATMADFQPPITLLDSLFDLQITSAASRRTVAEVSPITVVLTADQVRTAFEIESAIQEATKRGTHPGVVVLDGRAGIFKFDPQHGDDFSVNIAQSNLVLRGVNGAVLHTDGISIDAARMENVTIENLQLECPADCISSMGTLHRNMTIRGNNIIASNIAIGVSTPGSWWIEGNYIQSENTALQLGQIYTSGIFNNSIQASIAGIWLGSSSNQNWIIANTITNCQYAGIVLESGSQGNQVQGNQVTCAAGFGCLVIDAPSITLAENVISGNYP